MEECFKQARLAMQAGEVPIGAVISDGKEIIARAHNEVEMRKDATAHAEVLAIQRASSKIADWRLTDLILCVSLEPCTMCLGAIKQSRISTVVFGARDARAGACGSLYDLSTDSRSGLVPRVIAGVQEETAVNLLREFFSSKRVERNKAA